MVDYRGDLAVHVFGDAVPVISRMSATARGAGARVLSELRIGAEPEPIRPLVPGAVLLIELEGEGSGEAAIPLLDLAMEEADGSGRRSVISAPLQLIDLVAARTAHPDIEHLCEPSDEELVAALARAGRPREARLHDSGREGVPILQPLPATAAVRQPETARADAAFIRMLLRTRRLRTRFFRADLFADPAWDMLLDLMAARLEGKKVAVSSLCIAAAVPPTTALRWIGVLTDSDLVVRVADPDDGRRVYIELAEPTARALGAWLNEARRMAAETP